MHSSTVFVADTMNHRIVMAGDTALLAFGPKVPYSSTVSEHLNSSFLFSVADDLSEGSHLGIRALGLLQGVSDDFNLTL